MAIALVLVRDGRREDGRWQYGRATFTEPGKSEQTARNYLNMSGVILDWLPDVADQVVAGTMALGGLAGCATPSLPGARNRQQ